MSVGQAAQHQHSKFLFFHKPVANMASLKQAVQKLHDEKKRKLQEAAQKPRLVADCGMSVGDLACCLEDWLTHKGTKNLWATICPPVDGPVLFSFKTKPKGPWLAKVSGLVYDLLRLAPNTKVQSRKLKLAILSLLDDKKIVNLTEKNTEDFVDKLDVTVRIILAHFRAVKDDAKVRACVMRQLSARQMDELGMVLNRITPKDASFQDGLGGDENVDEEVQVKKKAALNREDARRLSDIFKPFDVSDEVDSEPVSDLAEMAGVFEKLQLACAMKTLRKPSTPQKLRPKSSTKPSERVVVTVDSESDVEADDAILTEAAAYVPKAAQAPAAKAKPKAKAKAAIQKKPAAAPKSPSKFATPTAIKVPAGEPYM